MEVSIRKKSFKIKLLVKNTGNSSFMWTGGLHPYWFTNDLLDTELHGLLNATLRDRFNLQRTIESRTFLSWAGEEYECLFDSEKPLILKTPNHSVRLSMSGFDQWMVWNPGKSGAQKLDNLSDGDWQHFICIEPVLVDRPKILQPDEIFEGVLSAELV